MKYNQIRNGGLFYIGLNSSNIKMKTADNEFIDLLTEKESELPDRVLNCFGFNVVSFDEANSTLKWSRPKLQRFIDSHGTK